MTNSIFESPIKLRLGFLLLANFFLVACSSTSTTTNTAVFGPYANQQPRLVVVTDYPVALESLLDEVKRSLVLNGYAVVQLDETEKGRNYGALAENRLAVYRTVKLANASGSAKRRSEVLVLFGLRTELISAAVGNELIVQAEGELIDANSNRFINRFRLPVKRLPAPPNCNRDCIDLMLEEQGKDIAAGIGEGLARQLTIAHNSLKPNTVVKSESNTVLGKPKKPISAKKPAERVLSAKLGLDTPYTLVFRRLSFAEVRKLMAVMSTEFPGYQGHDLITANPAVRRYSYTSRASTAKLEAWLSQLLEEQGLKPGIRVEIIVNGTEIIIERLG